MPWWIWLVLVVFMLVMLIAGLAYAALHLWRAFGKVSRTGAVIGEHMAAFQDTAPPRNSPSRRCSPSRFRWPPSATARPMPKSSAAGKPSAAAMWRLGRAGVDSTTTE